MANITTDEERLWLKKLESFKINPNTELLNELAHLIVDPDSRDFYNNNVFPVLKQYFRHKLEILKQNPNEQSLINELTELGVDEFYEINKIENPRLEPNIIFENHDWNSFFQEEIAPFLRQIFWTNKYEKFRENPTDILFFQLKKLGDFIEQLKLYQSEQWVNFYDNRVVPLLTGFAETKDKRLMISQYKRTGVINPFLQHLLSEINSHKIKTFQEIILLNDFNIAKRDREEGDELMRIQKYSLSVENEPSKEAEKKQLFVVSSNSGIIPPDASLIKRKFKSIESRLRKPNPWYGGNCFYVSAWDLGYISKKTKLDLESTQDGAAPILASNMYNLILNRYKPGYIVSTICGFTRENINSVLDMYLGINEYTMITYYRTYAALNEKIPFFYKTLKRSECERLRPKTRSKYDIIENSHSITVYKNDCGEIRYIDRAITTTDGMTYEEFLNHEKYIDSICLYFMIPKPNYPIGFLPNNDAFSPVRKVRKSPLKKLRKSPLKKVRKSPVKKVRKSPVKKVRKSPGK